MACRAAVCLAILSLFPLVFAAPAGAQAVPGSDGTVDPDLAGPCQVEAVLLESGVVIDPARSGGVYRVPIADTIAYRVASEPASAIGGEDSEDSERDLRGTVRLVVPKPFSSLELVDWRGRGAGFEAANFGYEMSPAFAPIGARFTLVAEHFEGDQFAAGSPSTCSGSVTVQAAGGFWDGALRPIASLATVGGLALMVWAATPRRRLGDRDRGGLHVGF